MTDLEPTDEVPPLGHLVELLTADRVSVASLARILTGTLADALPAGVVEVDVERRVADRMRGRPGQPVGVTVRLGEDVLTLTTRQGHAEAVVAHSVRGVVLSRRPVPVGEWVTTLAEGISALARHDAEARAALQRLLLG